MVDSAADAAGGLAGQIAALDLVALIVNEAQVAGGRTVEVVVVAAVVVGVNLPFACFAAVAAAGFPAC